MGQSERLTSLGRGVAAMQDRAPEARLDKEQGRARLLAEPIPRAGARRASRVVVLRSVAALAAALVMAAMAIALWPRSPLRFDLGATEPGIAGAWIAAPPAAELPIRFSEGTLLRLAPSGRARVVAVSAHGADIALERGTLDLAVVHLPNARWTVRVGPFQVKVIGTRFETSWDPLTERFTIAVREGAVTVTGPLVGDARPVRAGERLAVSTTAGTIEIGSIDAPVVSAPIVADAGAAPIATATAAPIAPVALDPTRPDPPYPPAQPATVEPSAPPVRAPRVPASAENPAVVAPAPPGWRALALDAKYKDALAASEREGFDTICSTVGAADLHALGDAARLGGSSARAAQAFTTVRKRFPGSAEAASAAFILGRMAQDQNKNYAAAADWFTRYLSEQPGGAFAADAAGRLVEVTDRMGNADGARHAAERYLARYPHGSHAAYARRVLTRGTDMPQ